MGRQAAAVIYVLAVVAVVAGADALFFRNLLWERLTGAASRWWRSTGSRSSAGTGSR